MNMDIIRSIKKLLGIPIFLSSQVVILNDIYSLKEIDLQDRVDIRITSVTPYLNTSERSGGGHELYHNHFIITYDKYLI